MEAILLRAHFVLSFSRIPSQACRRVVRDASGRSVRNWHRRQPDRQRLRHQHSIPRCLGPAHWQLHHQRESIGIIHRHAARCIRPTYRRQRGQREVQRRCGSSRSAAGIEEVGTRTKNPARLTSTREGIQIHLPGSHRAHYQTLHVRHHRHPMVRHHRETDHGLWWLRIVPRARQGA